MQWETLCFALVFILFAGYAVFGGFGLGVGTLHWLWRSDVDRRRAVDAIRPVWNFSEIWLLAGLAALVAAFPVVATTVRAAFGALLLVVLIALILRAASVQLQRRADAPPSRWRAWDLTFMFSSLAPALVLGLILGNLMRGLPIDARGQYQATFVELLTPYALLIGLLTVVMFAMHGSLYLVTQVEGSQRSRVERLLVPLWCAFALLHVIAAAATAWAAPLIYVGIAQKPLFWMLSGLWLAGLVGVPVFVVLRRYALAFSASALTTASMVGLVGVGLLPNLIPSGLGSGLSLSIYNGAASQRTLMLTLIVALVGLPIVIGYMLYVHRMVRAKIGALT